MKTKGILFQGMLILLMFFAGCEKENAPVQTARQQPLSYEGTIAAVGDSLTAGQGVNEEDAYPALLERKLKQAGYNWRVVNAGISGETSSGTLSRVNWILKLKPEIVILETGANDGLRGIDPKLTKKNIDETIRILKENKVTVVLAGMRMVTNLGRDYTSAFAAMYPSLAKKHDLILIPFFLAGVAGVPSLNQTDGIHPTAEGYRIITEKVYPSVKQAIEKRKREKTRGR